MLIFSVIVLVLNAISVIGSPWALLLLWEGTCIILAEGQEGGLRGGFLVFVSVCLCFFCKKVIILQVVKLGSLPI